ncbi:MAG: cytochrome c [Bauldia sp.]
MKKLGKWFVAGAVTATAVVLSLPTSAQQAAPQPTLATSYNALMVYMIDPSAHEIWSRQYQTTMSTDDWLRVEQHATNIVAATTLLAVKGTGQLDGQWMADPQWTALAATMRGTAQSLATAAQKKDRAALEKAGDALLDACEGCHKQFKLATPTEGIKHLPKLPF